MKILINRKNINEIIFVLYYFSFNLLRFFTVSYENYSTVILFCSSLVLIIASLINNKFKINKEKIEGMIEALAIMLFILTVNNFLFNNKSYDNLYYFTIYFLLPFYFIFEVSDYNKIVYLWSYVSCFIWLLYCIDPFIGYRISGDYMSFGFNFCLPAYIGSITLYYYYSKKNALVLSFFILFELIVFSNKGAAITGAIYLIVCFIYSSHNSKSITFIKSLILLIVGIIIIFNFDSIILYLYSLLKSKNVSSYSITSTKEMLNRFEEGSAGSRIKIWKTAFDVYKENPLFGKGFGYLEKNYGFYAHNIILDIMASSGIIGLLIFIYYYTKSLISICKIKDMSKKRFIIIIGISWFIPLMVSLSFWKSINFWLYFIVCLQNFNIKKDSKRIHIKKQI